MSCPAIALRLIPSMRRTSWVKAPGGRGTIRQGQVYRSGGRETSFAPSFRLVTDFADEAAHTALAGGPSDRRTSRWYASGLAAWQAGRLKPLRPR